MINLRKTERVKKMNQNTTVSTSPTLEPMLQFDRECEQALEMYMQAFGATVTYMGRFKDADPKDRPPCYNEEKDAHLIYHAQMMIGGKRILLCDNLFNNLPRGHSVAMVALFSTADEVKTAYSILAEGGTIVSPITSTTFTSACGTLVDKFGICWDIMC